MAYSVKVMSRAVKQFDGLSSAVRPRIAEALRKLAEDPRPAGCKRLRDRPDWSLRVGDWRIVYLLEDTDHAVSVTWIGPRGRAYRAN